MYPDTDTSPDEVSPGAEDVGAHRQRAGERVAAWLVAVIVVGLAVCIVLMAVAYHQAKTSAGTAHFTVFWLGILALVIVAVLAGLRLPATRWPPLVMLLAIGVITYLPKVFMSPSHPIYFDEYAHVRHAQDVLATGNIGVSNDLLPVIQYYPGLSVATVGVHYLTGLDLWHAGLILIGLAHCAALLLVLALGRAVGLAPRWAFFAALVFAANPGYMYFDSQYAYESLAIPLLLGAALCTIRARTAATSTATWRFTGGGVLLAALTVLTHHVSSAVMAVLCVLIAALVPASATRTAASADEAVPADETLVKAQRLGAWVVAGFAIAGSGIWNLLISSGTRSYVAPSLTKGITELFHRITGTSTSTGNSTATSQNSGVPSHTPFSGSGVPSYEKFFAYAVPVLVVCGLLFSLWRIWRGPERVTVLRRTAPFLIFTLAYLASLPLALTTSGNQAAHRSWPFFFVGVCIFGIWGVASWATRTQLTVRMSSLLAGGLVVVLMCLNIGDISSGANTAYRFPGPYTFGRDNRFDTAELNSVVRWADKHLPTSGRVITDRFTAQPLIVGTRLGVPTNKEAFANTLFKNPQSPSPELRRYLRSHHFRYFILDRHILTNVVTQPFYQGYPGRLNLDLQALGDITDSSFIRQVYATTHYRVYILNP